MKTIEFKNLDKKLQEEILERIKGLETTEIPYFINNEPVLIVNIGKVL